MPTGRSARVLGLIALVVAGALVLRWEGRVPEADARRAAPLADEADPGGPGARLQPTPGSQASASSDAVEHAPVAGNREPIASRLPRVSIDAVVRDPEGAAVAGARWAAFAGFDAPVDGTTGADGRVAFTARLRGGDADSVLPPVGLIVVHDDFAPCFARLDPNAGAGPSAGAGSVLLERAVSIAGAVTIHGDPPDEPIELELCTERFFWGPDGAPDEVWDAVGGRPRLPRSRTATTAERGAFVFDELVPGFTGTLTWSQERYVGPEVRVEGADPFRLVSLHVAAPAEGVLVALEDRAGIVGRVLDPLTELPVSDAILRIERDGRDGGEGREGLRGREQVQADGRFRLHLSRSFWMQGVPEEIELTPMQADGAGAGASRRVALPEAGLVDVGTLYVRPLRTLDFVVRAAGRAPIQRAEVEALRDERADGTATTDFQGRARLTTSLDATHARVAALGYETRAVVLPAGGAPLEVALEVVLEKGTLLDVLVIGDVASPRLRVESDEPLFLVRGEPSRRPELSRPSRSWLTLRDDLELQASGERRFLLGGLRPGVGFRLVASGFGSGVRRAAELQVAPLAPEEHRTLVLDIGGEDVSLHGRVVDPAGVPIAGAKIHVVAAPDAEAEAVSRAVTDAEGRFAGLRRLRNAAGVACAAEGFQTRSILVPPANAPLEIVLQPDREVRVELFGPGDVALPGARVEARLSDRRVVRSADERAPGEYVLRGLPDGPLVLSAVAAGRTFHRRLRAGEHEVRVDVPAWGAVEASLPPELAVAGAWLRLRPVDGDALPVAHALSRSAGPGLPVRVDVVFAGEYVAEVVHLGAGGAPEAVTGAAPVRVRAGELARVVLERRRP